MARTQIECNDCGSTEMNAYHWDFGLEVECSNCGNTVIAP